MHFITDRLTATGMGLAGLKKVSIATESDVSDILKETSETMRVVVITHELANSVKKDIEKLRNAGNMIIEIPDRSGSDEDFINKMIKDVIGFNIKSD